MVSLLANTFSQTRFQHYQVRKSGLPAISFHGLRHSYATILRNSGTSLKIASEALDHSNISTTADMYTHVTSIQQREAADRLDAAFEAARLTKDASA